MPSITIAIPTFNRKDRVSTLVQEIRPQLRPGDELVVSDDQSTDGTAEALSALPFVTVVRQPQNLGMVGNWNYCLTAGTRDWVCIVHDDDKLLPGGLEYIRRGCATANGPALVAHHASDDSTPQPQGGFCYRYREAGSIAVLDAEFCPSAVTIHRAIPESVGRFSPEHPYSADMEYFARVCARYPSLVITNPAVLRYVTEGQNYQLKTWKKPDFFERLGAVEAAAIGHAALPPEDAERLLRSRLRRDTVHMFRTAQAAGDAELVRRAAKEMLRTGRLTPRVRATMYIAALFGRVPYRLWG